MINFLQFQTVTKFYKKDKKLQEGTKKIKKKEIFLKANLKLSFNKHMYQICNYYCYY